jgi:hypothetical protein
MYGDYFPYMIRVMGWLFKKKITTYDKRSSFLGMGRWDLYREKLNGLIGRNGCSKQS